MKIHIAFNLLNAPMGGGNQFLKALRTYLRSANAYAERIEDAEAILVNGHQWGPYLFRLLRAKRVSHNIVILHRVDGPMALVRGREDNRILDKSIVHFNRHFADGTIFQSRWSRDLCIAHGLDTGKPLAVVHNAPDPSIFYPSDRLKAVDGKIRIVSTSWSSNWRKGFDVFQHLDRHLDFSRYAFTFIGNSPIAFENIRHIMPISSAELADELRSHDIFLQASYLEACSNSLIEAMNCGLIPVARNNSSHPEIVGDFGILYEGIDDVIVAIDMAAKGRAAYMGSMPPGLTLAQAGRAYLDFAVSVSRSPIARPGFRALLSTWLLWKMANRPGTLQKLRNLLVMPTVRRSA